jgi:hypothetical protein
MQEVGGRLRDGLSASRAASSGASQHLPALTLPLEPLPVHPYQGGMFFSKIDHWIGKTLFVPPIIKLCQLTRQTQFAVSRLFWFIAALDGFYHADTLFSSVLWGGMSVLMMITASQRADHPTTSFMFLRLLGVAFLALDLVKGAVTGEWAGTEFWLLVLIAEYASTIRTVPPRETTKVAAKAAARS